MKILALESSAKAASVAICEDDKLVCQYWQNSGLTHSRTLLKMAEGVLLDSGITMQNIDIVAVAKGPGSFTGIRIGVAGSYGMASCRQRRCGDLSCDGCPPEAGI